MTFTTTDGKPIGVPLTDYIETWLRENRDYETEVMVGTDSRQTGQYTHYVSVVVLYRKGLGGHIVMTQTRTPRIKVLFNRLWHEVELTYEITGDILQAVKSLPMQRLKVHLDINPDPEHASHVAYQAAMGYVKSLGLPSGNILSKPGGHAASFAADNWLQPRRVVASLEEA